jgi:hypothetical protein
LLCLLINKIGEEGRTGSAWKEGSGGGGDRVRDNSNNVYTYEYMNKNTFFSLDHINLRPFTNAPRYVRIGFLLVNSETKPTACLYSTFLSGLKHNRV